MIISVMLAVSALQSQTPIIGKCQASFLVGRRQVENLEISCDVPTDEAGAAEALRQQIDYRRRQPVPEWIAGQQRDIRFDVEFTEGSWTVMPRRLALIPHALPAANVARGYVGVCRVRFDIENGQPDVTGVNCIATGGEGGFERAAREAIEQWVYLASDNRQCRLTRLDFGLSEPGIPSTDELGEPEAPECPHR